MTTRNRVRSFGASILAVALGVLVGVIFSGVAADAVGIALVSLGSIAVVSLVFLEVGLSEDRERARERREQRRRPPRRRRRPE